MSAQTPVGKSSPLWKAWEDYNGSDDYQNTRTWAMREEHVDGSLWSAFEHGFRAIPAWPTRGEVFALTAERDAATAEVARLRDDLTALAMKWRGEADTWQRGIGDNQNTRLYREVAGEVDELLGTGGPTR